jgi:hypothetical protein
MNNSDGTSKNFLFSVIFLKVHPVSSFKIYAILNHLRQTKVVSLNAQITDTKHYIFFLLGYYAA